MIYDKNPPYPHYDHLPYAKEPWKSLYVLQRLFTTLALVPFWVAYYAVVPRTYRPRTSWNFRQIVNVNFTRRIYKVTEVAGVTWGTRDPTVAPNESRLKETRFEWANPLPEEYRTGIVNLPSVPFKQVGCYVWPKVPHSKVQKAKKAFIDDPSNSAYMDLESAEDVPLIGLFMHGGGYCHMSAHESSRTSRIPRNLIKKNILHEVYSVEYRLLQHAPFPAVVQDAASVYYHVVETFRARQQRCKIILIGDSSGGNLVLALARWIRDEKRLPLADGLILLSPSCDTTSALPATLSSYIPRPNKNTDYLVDTPEPRALLQRTFLGFQYRPGPATPEEEQRLMEIVHSEYVSPCSPVVLKRWGHEIKQDPEGYHQRSFIQNVFKRLPTTLRIARSPEALSGHGTQPSNYSVPVRTSTVAIEGGDIVPPPASAPAAQAADEHAKVIDPAINSGPMVSLPPVSPTESTPPGSSNTPSDTTQANHFPQPTYTFPSLFDSFPRTLVVCGDAERLVREVRSLIAAMERDGVDLDICWAPDACHDILQLNEYMWDRKVLAMVWAQIGRWAEGFNHKSGGLASNSKNGVVFSG